MRYACVLALSLLLVGAAGAASAKPSPLELAGVVESRGAADLGSAPGRAGGELLRFLPRSQLQLGLLLHNGSGGRLVIVAARVIEPAGTLIHQIGTRFHPWHVFKCPPGAMCPAHVFPLESGPAVPRPYSLATRRYVGVELDFQLGSCSQIPQANPAPVSRLRVTFRQDGTIRRRIFSLGASALRLRTPKRGDCSDPRSSLSVDGPQQYTSSSYWTIPGSAGDVCTSRNGRLYFLSRKYQTHTSRTLSPRYFERVSLQVGHFRGTGSYRATTVKLVAGKKVVFRRHGATVDVTRATKREVTATIDVGRKPSSTTRGIPFRIYGTLRCRVR